MKYDISKLVRARTVKGWTRDELARRAGTHPTTIGKIESGKTNALPTTMKSIADLLDLDMEDLVIDESTGIERKRLTNPVIRAKKEKTL